ncbi:hypothetical protein AC579_9479 [Pseudocercospora musae]|uniref:Extracellular mutant protein 11 C-terminal domain-containing protein n=1 Tax=Pseudocercospora musae TaxID=113226 RepID=A0A139HBP6_9PEZI|nr:hypothetical protein AC579_9479 [Pseudocercospora musae]
MAKDNEQGLHGFVMRQRQRQHGDGGYDGQNDVVDLSECKVAPNGKKGSASANMQTARSNARRPSTRSGSRTDSAPHAQHNIFVTTDASAADRTSTAGSARDGQHKTQQQLENSQPKSRNVHEPSDYDHGVEEEKYTHDQEFVDGSGNAQRQPRISSGDAHHETMPQSTIHKRLSGDSYPETTSGTPSVVDPNAMQGHQGQINQYAPTAMPSRGPGGRAIPPGGEHVQAQAPTPKPPLRAGLEPPNLYSQPGPKNTTALIPDVPQGFSFALAQPTQLNMARPGQQPAQARASQPNHLQQPQRQHQQEQVMSQQEQQQQQVRASTRNGHRSVPTDQAQHGSEVPTKAHTPAEHEPQQHPVVGGRGETRSPFEHAQQQLLSKQRANRTGNPLQQRPVLPSEAEQEYSDGADPGFNGYPSVNGHDEQYPPVDESLDYEEKELVKMDYSHLKAMPFDTDPNMLPFEFDSAEQPDTLDEKFKAAASLPPDTQADFLGTLNLEEWEQAGDWFLVRFADLATRFKNARNAKRKAAREFESEIERRHEMVAKKQKLTEIAMNNMKESGGKVLQGTPKKTRKVK